jgi:rubrerythrin
MVRRLSVLTLVIAAMSFMAAIAFGGEGAKAAKASTLDNLQKAYANGSLAKAQCEAFAAKADEEGYKSAATLFRASAKAESIHLEKYAVVIKSLGAEAKTDAAKPEVKTTKENLLVVLKAVNGNSQTYADYVKQAEADKNEKAVMFLKGALADEASRAKLYRQAADELDNWKAAGKEVLVCLVCGYTTMDAVKTCPVCSAPREKFESFK